MARHTAQQLPLPGSFDEAAQLGEDLASYRAHCVSLREIARQAEQEAAAARQLLAEVTRDRDSWRTHAQHLQVCLDLTRGARTLHPRLETWVGQEFRTLLAWAHPNKWSQGQPAEVLAHEVVVVINGLRERLEGGHV